MVATFFGEPVVAGFLIAKNYKVFGNDDAARDSIFIGILSTILLFIGIFMNPEYIIDKLPKIFFPGVYNAIIAVLVEKLQGQKIKKFLADNEQKASNWQATKYGLLELLIISTFWVAIIFLIPLENQEKSITIDQNVTLYYSDDIEEVESRKIAATTEFTRIVVNDSLRQFV